jgi:GDSL-like Lipase/Acylhydrolase family
MTADTPPILREDTMPARLRLATALAFVLFTAFTAAPASAAPVSYVALGDSSVSGPLLFPLSSWPCQRSYKNWPNVIAGDLGDTLTDVSCSGAHMGDMTSSQQTDLGPVPPQFDPLGPGTGLVTTSIAANDADLVGLADSCLRWVQTPDTKPCVDDYVTGGVDKEAVLIASLATQFGQMLQQIHLKAPNARVVVVGYGTYLPPGGCYPLLPEDADYVQASIGRLDTMMAQESAANGAEFIDIRGVTQGHDVCEAPNVKWYENAIPTSVAAPLHPNANGMAGIGAYLAGVIGGQFRAATTR